MPKERSINPAAAHLKSEKAKALAKSRGLRQQQRQEKLARRNPDRLQRQIDELKDKETKGLALSSHEKKTLEELERDVKAVKKAREALGVPQEQERGQRGDRGRGERGRGGFRGRGSGRGGFNGGQSRQRGADGDGGDSDSSTASSVADIPLPTGPPPLKQLQIGRKDVEPLPAHLTGLPSKPGVAGTEAGAPKVAQPVVTTYSSAPVMRDLRKEATVFMPAAVKKQKKIADAIEKIKKDAEDLNIEDE
ncbi:hypothetical protein TWF225_009793 [Orbilia oligospora]|uniref:Wbp11/ELF5/Saf1 N-terminal domain-containing protein n=1 Tax=Orbilia oligospora TaxID=2813651 RepID=A0A7C8PCM9_ORBOL|nr:hypothetical protein TWF751_006632 [Orbilia oligospora]KAF3173517.1 hypothetical protein TWF225_009793 [Orbilia oligospora]KAF3246716.1 hypothetical protein TWF128_008834 [Orbilia oligospora]KAF3257838.1 hypothetical protein TWF217_005942 [Orbilia oligospora]KAF3278058.1 hypothetical protein TWF132_001315 [Orbilia oligospora]